MVEKGNKHKEKRESRKAGKLTLKEKRKKKKERKTSADLFEKIRHTED